MVENKKKITILTAKDLDVSYFCGSGNGGSARNKVASGVQIIHRASGAIGRASDTRSQLENKHEAFKRLTKTVKFKIWLNKKLYEIECGEKLEETIIKETQDKFLRFEIKKDGKWQKVEPEYFDGEEAKKII